MRFKLEIISFSELNSNHKLSISVQMNKLKQYLLIWHNLNQIKQKMGYFPFFEQKRIVFIIGIDF